MKFPARFDRPVSNRMLQKWTTREGWKDLLTHVSWPELEQALLRLAVPAMVMAWLLGDLLITGDLEPREWNGLYVALVFFAFSAALIVHILVSGDSKPKITVVRRFLAIFADNLVNTFFLLVTGESGAIVVGIYLFVAFGNGFRFGRLYLHVSQALSLIGFAIVLNVSPFWKQHLWIGFGYILAMVVLPLYVGKLAERIKDARKRADEANAAKGRFLANVSHEMRTPLNGVLAMTDLLRETRLAAAQQEIVETLSTSAELALAQIEEILDAAKLEAGGVQLESRPFELAKILTGAVKLLFQQERYNLLSINVDITQEA